MQLVDGHRGAGHRGRAAATEQEWTSEKVLNENTLIIECFCFCAVVNQVRNNTAWMVLSSHGSYAHDHIHNISPKNSRNGLGVREVRKLAVWRDRTQMKPPREAIKRLDRKPPDDVGMTT